MRIPEAGAEKQFGRSDPCLHNTAFIHIICQRKPHVDSRCLLPGCWHSVHHLWHSRLWCRHPHLQHFSLQPAAPGDGSLQSSNTGPCGCTGPLEGRAGIMYQQGKEKEGTLMHSSTREARSRLEICAPKVDNNVPIFRLYFIISREWSFDPYSPLLRYKTELEERFWLFISFLTASLGYLNCDENSESMW